MIEFSEPDAVNINSEVHDILGWDGTPDSEHRPPRHAQYVAGSSGDKMVSSKSGSQAGPDEFLHSQAQSGHRTGEGA